MLVHPDPIVGDECETGRVNTELGLIVREIDERISVHDVRIVPCSNETKVIFDCVVPSDCKIKESTLTEEITRFLRLKFPDCRPVITYDYGYAAIPKTEQEE